MENPELENRLNNIESRLGKLEALAFSKNVEERISNPTSTRKIERPSPVQIPTRKAETEDEEPNGFIEWIKTDWLMKLGGLLLIIALGWFVTYAFLNNWIGPVGRIALGIITGVVFMGVGHWQIPKRKNVGEFLVAIGGVMTLLTLFSARMFYNFFTPITAMGMMSFVVIAMATIATLRDSKGIAYLALIGGAAVPFLIDSPDRNIAGLLSYIFILDVGVLIVTALRGWRSLTLTALIITAFYSFTFGDLPKETTWIFMTLFYGLFFSASAAAVFHSKKAFLSDLFTTGGSGILFLFWVAEFVPREWASLLLSALILVMIGIGYTLKRIGNLKHPLMMYLALAVVFLGTATVFELDGNWVTIAFTLEALALTVLSSYLVDKKTARITSALQTIPALMSLGSMDSYKWERAQTLFHEDFFVLLILALCLVGTAIYFKKTLPAEEDSRLVSRIHYTSTIAVSIILIWLSTKNIFVSEDIARGVSLVIYALSGVSLIFYGGKHDSKYHNTIGGIILGGVVLRLLFVEVWKMPLAGRIITFVAIGLLLVATAFFKKKLIHTEPPNS